VKKKCRGNLPSPYKIRDSPIDLTLRGRDQGLHVERGWFTVDVGNLPRTKQEKLKNEAYKDPGEPAFLKVRDVQMKTTDKEAKSKRRSSFGPD